MAVLLQDPVDGRPPADPPARNAASTLPAVRCKKAFDENWELARMTSQLHPNPSNKPDIHLPGISGALPPSAPVLDLTQSAAGSQSQDFADLVR